MSGWLGVVLRDATERIWHGTCSDLTRELSIKPGERSAPYGTCTLIERLRSRSALSCDTSDIADSVKINCSLVFMHNVRSINSRFKFDTVLHGVIALTISLAIRML